MTQRQIFNEDYTTFCQKLAPHTQKEDLSKGVQNRTQTNLKTTLQESFWRKVNTFFLSIIPTKKKEIFNINDILQSDFIVGEDHGDISPKKFLIENMTTLKEQGFTTLFMEHLYYDDQNLLDQYYNSGIMPEKLKNALSALNKAHGNCKVIGDRDEEKNYYTLWNKYNFMTVVEAAQAAGIRVVAIDIKAVYESQQLSDRLSSLNTDNTAESTKRIQAMNYTAQVIIKREQGNNQDGKWFALMGNAHVNKMDDIFGVADIFNIPSLYIFDAAYNEKPGLSYLTKKKIGSHILNCDVCLITEKSGEAFKLNSEKKRLENK